MKFSMFFGFSNVFALPFAVSSENAFDNDGVDTLSIHIGPFMISLEWVAE